MLLSAFIQINRGHHQRAQLQLFDINMLNTSLLQMSLISFDVDKSILEDVLRFSLHLMLPFMVLVQHLHAAPKPFVVYS